MACRASGIAFAAICCLIGGIGIFAIIDSIADGCHCNTALIGARKLAFSARSVSTSLLVRVVAAVVFVIAFPRFEDAPAVAASVLDRSASVE